MARTVTTSDGAASKMAKYVPAEMVTIATAFFAAFDPSSRSVWGVMGVGAVLNVLYLFSVAHNDTGTDVPQKRFYWLSAAAFVLWSAATIDEVAVWAHLDKEIQRAFVLLAAAFILPLLDSFRIPGRGAPATSEAATGTPP